jgi:hypothetical protein
MQGLEFVKLNTKIMISQFLECCKKKYAAFLMPEPYKHKEPARASLTARRDLQREIQRARYRLTRDGWRAGEGRFFVFAKATV